MPTLLLTARHTDDTQKLWRACIDAGWNVERVHNWRVPPVKAEEVCIYGEPLFAHHVAQTLALRLIEPTLDWLPLLPLHCRGREIRLTTLAEARKVDERSFIKPASDKCFEARVYSTGAELPPPGTLPEDLPVLVQEVLEWSLEFRCFVLDGRVMTVSPYWRDGHSAESESGKWDATEVELQEATSFCNSVLSDLSVKLPEAVAVDVGVIRNKKWAVIECNAAWGAGIYGCDPTKVLQVLRRACVVR